MTRKIAAGQDILAICGKCKMVLNHVIHAVVGETPVRVECKTCHAIHKYRPDPEARKKAPSRTPSAQPRPRSSSMSPSSSTSNPRPAKVEALRAEYEALSAGRDPAEAIPFNVRVVFEQGGLVNHPQFGMGVVTKVHVDRKIDVLFADGARTLVHAR